MFVRADGIAGEDVGGFLSMDLGVAVVTFVPRYDMVAMKSLSGESDSGMLVLCCWRGRLDWRAQMVDG